MSSQSETQADDSTDAEALVAEHRKQLERFAAEDTYVGAAARAVLTVARDRQQDGDVDA